jgi:ABC-type amino acid transport substrate-binding protein
MRGIIFATALIASFVSFCEPRREVLAQGAAAQRGGPATIPPSVASPTPSPPPPNRLALIRARGEVAVCHWPEYFAISWRNPRTGELEGLDIDMGRALAARLSARPVFVETNFAEVLDRLEEGACDIAMMGVGVTPARAERVAFSKPYLSSGFQAVTTRSNARIQSWRDLDTPGTVVAVAAGTTMEAVMRETLRNAELMVVRAPRTREAEVQAGRADAFIADRPYAQRMLLVHDWARVVEAPPRFGETLYAYAVARGDPAWLTEVNAFLERAQLDGTLARAAQRHGLAGHLLPEARPR